MRQCGGVKSRYQACLFDAPGSYRKRGPLANDELNIWSLEAHLGSSRGSQSTPSVPSARLRRCGWLNITTSQAETMTKICGTAQVELDSKCVGLQRTEKDILHSSDTRALCTTFITSHANPKGLNKGNLSRELYFMKDQNHRQRLGRWGCRCEKEPTSLLTGAPFQKQSSSKREPATEAQRVLHHHKKAARHTLNFLLGVVSKINQDLLPNLNLVCGPLWRRSTSMPTQI